MSEQPHNPEQPGEPPQPPPPPQASGSAPAGGDQGASVPLTKDEKNLGMLCHLLALAGIVVPLGNIIGPLVLWLLKKDESAFVDEQGKESLNFQITATIAMVVCIALFFLVITVFLAIAIWIADLIIVILASVKVSNGEGYRYPMSLRLIK